MSAQQTLVGVREIADTFGITPGAVVNWTTRHADFPEPVAELAMGRVWAWHEVEAWHEERWPSVVDPEADGDE